MKKEKRSQYSYSEGEKEILRALKMQEMEIESIESRTEELRSSVDRTTANINDTSNQVDDLKIRYEALRKRVESISTSKGLSMPESLKITTDLSFEDYIDDSPLFSEKKISYSDIPSWDSVMEKTDIVVPEDVFLEDLLSAEEFQFCKDEIKRINDEFSQKTGLNKKDIVFLMTATALQTARWILIQYIMGDLGQTIDPDTRISSKEGDKIKKKDINRWNEKQEGRENIKSDKYPTWKDIIFGQYKRVDGKKTEFKCPYDAQEGGPIGFDDGGRGQHRANTLGHDPILGWIFGSANLMTCTISLSKKFAFNTYRVIYPGGRFGEICPMPLMFSEMFESIKEDKFRLPAALAAQYFHLKSDVNSTFGLPVPLLETLTKDITGKLYSEQYDSLCLLGDLKIIGAQAGFSIFINMLVSLIHGILYNPDKDGKRELYEVRTRKILLFSNVIATSINLAYVGVNAHSGNVGEALKKLDLGGLLVTLWRLFSDIRFITSVKKQFIQDELDKVTKESIDQLNMFFE